MAAQQQEKDYARDLEKLTDQQLRALLQEEMDSEELNIAWIKAITGVLAARAGEETPDAEAAYQRFLEQSGDGELLYDELAEELAAENEAGPVLSTAEEESPAEPRRVVRLSRRVRTGILIAAVLTAFLALGITAAAKDFRIGRADVSWDKDNMTVSTIGGEPTSWPEDPFFQIRKSMQQDGVEVPVVPHYLPEGFELTEVNRREVYEGLVYDVNFRSDEEYLLFDWFIDTQEMNAFFPKDEGEPELYTVNGIEHVITTNMGTYRAVWSNGDVYCIIYGFPEKEELLKVIDSIYQEP